MAIRKLELTEALRARIQIVRICEPCVNQGGLPGLSPSNLDYLKAELADELLAELARQEMRRVERVDEIDALLERKPVPVVEVELRRKRRTRA